MPGKVNPVICEFILQVSAQVIANDLAVTIGALGSVLELNLMLPLIAHNLLYSTFILSNKHLDKICFNLYAVANFTLQN